MSVAEAAPRAPAAAARDDWVAAYSPDGELAVSGRPTDPFAGNGAPFEWRSDDVVVLFDGVLHDEDELRRAAEAPPGASGAELVWHAYRRWGTAVVHHLRGGFALVVLDRADGRLFATRDAHGVYPLFYADAGGWTLVSKSLDALVADGRVPGDLNRAALADHLCHRFPDPGETYYQHVRRVPPGHAMEVAPPRKRVYRYWGPLPEDREIEWVREEELGRFPELLDQAVARCLGGGPVGIFLSGGLDSISVAAVAADLCRRDELTPPTALSIVFPHPETNEEPVQRAVAADLELPLVITHFDDAVGRGRILAAALDASASWPAPMFNLWYPAYHHLGLEARARGVTTILTGTGGDEWLSVTPFYAGDLMRSLDLGALVRLWGSFQRSYRLPQATVVKRILWTFGLRAMLAQLARETVPRPMWRRTLRTFVRAIPDWVAPDPVLQAELIARAEQMADHVLRSGARGLYRRELQDSLDHALVAMEAEETFERSRRMGVRVFHPLCDPDLLDFLHRTPPELLNRGGRSKGLVRETLAARFPELGFDRQRKVSATAFVRDELHAQAPVAWRELGGTRALAELGVVEPRKLEATLDRMVRERAPHAHLFWDVLTLEVWARARL